MSEDNSDDDLRNDIALLQKILKQKEEILSSLKSQIANLTSSNKTKDETISSLKSQISNLTSSNKTKDDTLNNFSNHTPNVETTAKLKETETELNELKKKVFDYEQEIQNQQLKINSLCQENSQLQLEIKKVQISSNNPGKIISSLSKQLKSQGDAKVNDLLKENAELKESNQKLVLVLSEKESEISSLSSSFATQINTLSKELVKLRAKNTDISNELTDVNNQLTAKEKEIEQLEQAKNILIKYNQLKAEFDQYKANCEIERENNAFELQKIPTLQAKNKELTSVIEKTEREFNELLIKGTITCQAMDDLSCYVTLSENLRSQVIAIDEEKEEIEKKLSTQIKKNRNDYKKLEDIYLETYQKLTDMEKELNQAQEDFIGGSMRLNQEISFLNKQISNYTSEREKMDKIIQELTIKLNTLQQEFKTLQNTMTKLREKDEVDITLIEERYILLENMLEMEKSEVITQNRQLLNKIRKLEKKGASCIDLLIDDEYVQNFKQEVKLLTEENRLLQFKLKEQEKTISQYEKLSDEYRLLQTENTTLKGNIQDNKTNYEKVIQSLQEKASQLNNELFESRKRNSNLRSKPRLSKNEMNMSRDNKELNQNIEELQKELKDLKRKKEEDDKIHLENLKNAENELVQLKGKIAEIEFNKDNELLKYKNQAKNYYKILVDKGIIKKQ